MMETIQPSKKQVSKKDHQCGWCELPIYKGVQYERAVFKYDGFVYAWKNHILCGEIASKLEMFSYADEGVSAEFFKESIQNEYMNIMSTNHNEEYESKDFRFPSFKEQLFKVLKHHGL